ncbi:MAG: zinc-binding dehydrogenase [Gemmatimonadota bacterium]
MKAASFRISIPGFLLARTLGRFHDIFLFGRPSGLRFGDVPSPELPGPRWVRLQVLACGICGSDVGNFTYTSSPAMEPFGSFPAVPGHEILARVTGVGPEVRGVEVGQRVGVDPMLSCPVRGFPSNEHCTSCRQGLHATCGNAGEDGPVLERGLTVGYHRQLPGGWSEEMVAHESQLFPLADALEDPAGVLLEPLAIAMHAVLRTPLPSRSDPVLVVGSGPIALATVWALRAVGFQGEVVAQTKRARERALADALGASSLISPGDEARQAMVDTGAMAYQPLVGPEVYSGGGFPLIFDCVGNQGSLSQALRYAAPRGRIVLLGCAGELRKLDLTFLWARELDVKGFVGYGREEWRGHRRHTFQVTHDLLLESQAPVGDLVTHVVPLEGVRGALAQAANRRKSGALKVVLVPPGSPFR